MSCDVAVAAYLFLASASPNAGPAAPVPAIAAPAASLVGEPLFVDIVARAGRLKAQVETYRKGSLAATGAAESLPGFHRFETGVGELAALDMKGHLELAQRGTDGDLKCILRGISQDLPVKLHDLIQAPTGQARDAALRDMAYLLNDNVEVITAPPAPPA